MDTNKRELGTKYQKTFNGIVKSIDVDKKQIEVVVSTGSIDRDKEIILPEAFSKRLKVYKAHPVLLSSHSYNNLLSQIGKAVAIKSKDNELIAKFEYFVGEGNPEADWAFKLAEKGIAAFSIGFIGHDADFKTYEEYQKNGIWTIWKDVELLEISQVLVPSNRDALLGRRDAEDCGVEEKELCEMAIKSFGFDKKEVVDSEYEKIIQECGKMLAESYNKLLRECKKMLADNNEKLKNENKELITKMNEKDSLIVQDVIKTLKQEAEDESLSKLYKSLIFGSLDDKSREGDPEKKEINNSELLELLKFKK
jgi:HK97 family phage prohead protease